MKRRFTLALLAAAIAFGAAVVPAPAQAGPRAYEIWFGHSGKSLTPMVSAERSTLHSGSCRSVPQQLWYFDLVAIDSVGIPFWRIRNSYSGLCVSNGGSNSGPLYQEWCGAANWKDVWQLHSVSGTSYHLLVNAQNHLCATLPAGDDGKVNGATVQQAARGLGITQYVALS